MHHPRESIIDGVKFVLIPEELHDQLVILLKRQVEGFSICNSFSSPDLYAMWRSYDPEVFDAI